MAFWPPRGPLKRPARQENSPLAQGFVTYLAQSLQSFAQPRPGAPRDALAAHCRWLRQRTGSRPGAPRYRGNCARPPILSMLSALIGQSLARKTAPGRGIGRRFPDPLPGPLLGPLLGVGLRPPPRWPCRSRMHRPRSSRGRYPRDRSDPPAKPEPGGSLGCAGWHA